MIGGNNKICIVMKRKSLLDENRDVLRQNKLQSVLQLGKRQLKEDDREGWAAKGPKQSTELSSIACAGDIDNLSMDDHRKDDFDLHPSTSTANCKRERNQAMNWTETEQPPSRVRRSKTNKKPNFNQNDKNSVGINEEGLPKAFAYIKNGVSEESEDNEINDAEMSDHEAEMIRMRRQFRIKERWGILRYKLLTSSLTDHDNSMMGNDQTSSGTIKEEWNEEREREFVFSLL